MKDASVIRKLGKVGGQAGAIAVIMAAAMLVFLGFMGLALDVGRLVVIKSDLQKAADAGARAGATVPRGGADVQALRLRREEPSTAGP